MVILVDCTLNYQIEILIKTFHYISILSDTHTHTCTEIHTLTNTCTHVTQRIQPSTHIYTYTPTHTHTHEHTRIYHHLTKACTHLDTHTLHYINKHHKNDQVYTLLGEMHSIVGRALYLGRLVCNLYDQHQHFSISYYIRVTPV